METAVGVDGTRRRLPRLTMRPGLARIVRAAVGERPAGDA
jgi:hypothetical protein